MSIVAKKILMGSGGVDLPSEDQFNRVSFLSHFDGANNGVNNAFDDGSTSNHTITANGNVTQGSFGPFARPDGEWGVSFDGTTAGYISVPTDTDFDFTNATTLEFWVNIPEDQTDVLVLGRHDMYWFGADYAGGGGSANKFSWLVAPTGGGSFSSIHSSADIVYNQWYFVQLIYSGTTVTFYLDGSSQGTITNFTPHVNASKPFYVGGYAAQLNAHAIVSNVRFSNVARATTVPTSAFSVDSNTKLLLCSNNRFTDRSSQAATVSAYAGAAVTSFGPFLTSKVYDPAVNGASAANFSSSSDYITVADSSDFTLGNTFTLEAWIYPTVSNAYNSVQNQNGSSGYYWAHVAGEKMQFYRSVGSAIQHDSAASSMVNQWTHVAYVCAGGTAYHYINGVRSGSSVSMSVADISAVITIGLLDGSYLFPGFISDYRMVVGTAVYSGTTYTVPTAPLTAITNTKLLLNMADGQAIDSAAHSIITLSGNANVSTDQAKFGNTSLHTDGSGDAALVKFTNAGDLNFGTGDFTLECFVRFADTDNTQVLISNWESGGNTWYLAHYGGSNKLTFYPNAREFAWDPSANTWYHMALTRASGVLKAFVDGTQIGSNISETANLTGANNHMSIGGAGNAGESLNGFFDEVRVSKFARYTSNFTAPSEPFADKGQ